jgi:hypothetical protein
VGTLQFTAPERESWIEVVLRYAEGGEAMYFWHLVAEYRAAWFLREVDGSGLTIAVMMGGCDCYRFARVDVVESDEAVELEAWVERLYPEGCFMVSLFQETTVLLDKPLGHRTLAGCMLKPSAAYNSRASCEEIVDEEF